MTTTDGARSGDGAASTRDVAPGSGDPGDIEVARFTGDPWSLRERLSTLWVEVTHAGGAIGFRPPVTVADVAPAVDTLLEAAAGGRSAIVVAVRPAVASGRGQELVGLVAVTRGAGPREWHRVTLERLQVHPTVQGRGIGARLVEVAHAVAVAEFGAELALAVVRDGLGLERFYERLGYTCCAYIPDGLAFENVCGSTS